MVYRRSRLEISIEVLDSLSSGVCKPTHILYNCRVPWGPLQEILDTMTKQKIVRVVKKKSRRTYEITEKGTSTLMYFSKLQSSISVY